MIKVFVSGQTGKMGVQSVAAIQDEPDLQYCGGSRSIDNLAQMLKEHQPDVVLDLTHPSCVFENVKTILNANAHAVVGTTGLSTTQLEELDRLAKSSNKAVLICPNFAIGAILMMHFAAQAAKYLPRVEIIEYHHDKKADSPSGTAIKTAEMIHHINGSINASPEHRDEGPARGSLTEKIPIHSIRLPGYVASQDVIFGGLGQTLSLRHDTISREAFMPGVILSIRKVGSLTGVVYGLEKILSL